MKKSFILCAFAALLLCTLASCNHQERHLVRFSVVDSAQQFDNPSLYEFVWQDDLLQLVRHNNPNVLDGPQYDFFHYDASYTYENGHIASITGNKYRTLLSYENDKLVRAEQYSIEGNILTHRAIFSYLDDNKVKASYYAMPQDAIIQLESVIYHRTDSTGAPLALSMPEDTSLSLSSEALYQYQDGNLVSVSATIDGFMNVETKMEYDNKINPLCNTLCQIDKLDVFPLSMAFGHTNDMANSKNNLTKVVVKMLSPSDSLSKEVVFEYSYEYDGDYPVVQHCFGFNSKFSHIYEYDK